MIRFHFAYLWMRSVPNNDGMIWIGLGKSHAMQRIQSPTVPVRIDVATVRVHASNVPVQVVIWAKAHASRRLKKLQRLALPWR